MKFFSLPSFSSTTAWLILLAAGIFEVIWAIGLKYADGFSRFWPSVVTVAAMIVSVVLLGAALRQLPVSIAYAVWTGIGAAGTAAIGMTLLNEPASLWRIACIGLILAGVLGLKFGN